MTMVWIHHVFELAAFEGHEFEADLPHGVRVSERLHDDANAAGEGGVVGVDVRGTEGGVVATAGGEGAHADDDGFLFASAFDGVVNEVAGGDFAAGGIDGDDNGANRVVFDGLFELELDVVDHGIADVARHAVGDEAIEAHDDDLGFHLRFAIGDDGFAEAMIALDREEFADEEEQVEEKAEAEQQDQEHTQASDPAW
jgi:hypothetical protein